MAHRYFPELNRDSARHLLRDGVIVTEQDHELLKELDALADMGIVRSRSRRYVRCTFQRDYDYLERPDLRCQGTIEILPNEDEDEYYCSNCGEPIGDLQRKTVFVEYVVTVDREGIGNYLEASLTSLDCVSQSAKTGIGTLDVQMTSGRHLSVAIAEYAGARAQYSGLFFDAPTLYVTASPINETVGTVLDAKQHLVLAEMLTLPRCQIEERVLLASIPISGHASLEHIESRFDVMLVRHEPKSWQFLEQVFVPAFVTHIASNPRLVQDYLMRLQKLVGTVFGEYHVPIGGAGAPDLRPIDKFRLMNQLFAGNSIGDAKCYSKSSLSYDDVSTINLHIDRERGAETSVVYLTTDQVASTAWSAIMDLEFSDGRWKIIVLTKYLILELIEQLHATELLEL